MPDTQLANNSGSAARGQVGNGANAGGRGGGGGGGGGRGGGGGGGRVREGVSE